MGVSVGGGWVAGCSWPGVEGMASLRVSEVGTAALSGVAVLVGVGEGVGDDPHPASRNAVTAMSMTPRMKMCDLER